MGILPGEKLGRRLTVAVTAVVMVGTCMIYALVGQNGPRGATETPPPQTELPELTLNGMTILVDPGHGGYDGGARCGDSGTWEKELNLAVALAAEKSLTLRGASVVMTRRKDEDLCSDDRPAGQTRKRQDMERRVAMAVEHKADLVLSIHMNHFHDRRQAGPQVFFRSGCDAGRLLAGCVQAALIDGVRPQKEREAASGDYFILRLDVPSVLVECGFISNSEDEAKLSRADYQAQVAEAIARGVEEYVTVSRRLNGQTQ